MSEKEYKVVPITQVEPDPHQPRQNFEPSLLAKLAESIKGMGIQNPITVEKKKDGTYQIVDGERRYRAAKILGLKTVPVYVIDELTDVDRVVKQFHLQEMHEGWTPHEKAIAIRDLANSLKVTMKEVGKMLGIESGSVRSYIAFIGLAAHTEFTKSETPMRLAGGLASLTKVAKSEYIRQTEKDFDSSDEKDFQIAIIERLKKGDIKTNHDFAKIKDAIVKDANTVDEILAGEKSTEKIFVDAKAETTTAVRQFNNTVRTLAITTGHFEKIDGAIALLDENETAKRTLKNLTTHLQNIVNQLD